MATIQEMQDEIDALSNKDELSRADRQRIGELERQAIVSRGNEPGATASDKFASAETANRDFITLSNGIAIDPESRGGAKRLREAEQRAGMTAEQAQEQSQLAGRNAAANTEEWQKVVQSYNSGGEVPQAYVPLLSSLNSYYQQGQAAPGKLEPDIARQAFKQWQQDALPGGWDKAKQMGAMALLSYMGGAMLSAAMTPAGAVGFSGPLAGYGTSLGTTTGGTIVGSAGLLGSTSSAALDTALNAAATQGLTSAGTTLAMGGNLDQAGKSFATGAISAGFSSFIPGNLGQTIAGGNGVMADAINAAAPGAVKGGVDALANDANVLQGMATGAAASGAGAATASWLDNPSSPINNTVKNTAAGTVSGVVGATMSGGDAGTGAENGFVGGLFSGVTQDLGGSQQLGNIVGKVGSAAVKKYNPTPVVAPINPPPPKTTPPVVPKAPRAGFSSFRPGNLKMDGTLQFTGGLQFNR